MFAPLFDELFEDFVDDFGPFRRHPVPVAIHPHYALYYPRHPHYHHTQPPAAASGWELLPWHLDVPSLSYWFGGAGLPKTRPAAAGGRPQAQEPRQVKRVPVNQEKPPAAPAPADQPPVETEKERPADTADTAVAHDDEEKDGVVARELPEETEAAEAAPAELPREEPSQDAAAAAPVVDARPQAPQLSSAARRPAYPRQLPTDALVRRAASSDLLPRVPHMEVKDLEKEVHLRFELPGIRKEDCLVELDEDCLKVSGRSESRQETRAEDGSIRSSVSCTRSFQRSIRLPLQQLDAAKVEARFEDGLLQVTIPKLEVDPKPQVKRIQIQ